MWHSMGRRALGPLSHCYEAQDFTATLTHVESDVAPTPIPKPQTPGFLSKPTISPSVAQFCVGLRVNGRRLDSLAPKRLAPERFLFWF